MSEQPTETPSAPASVPPPARPLPAPRSRRSWPPAFLLWLVLLMALGAGSTWLWRHHGEVAAQMQQQQATLAALVQDLNAAEAQLARLETRHGDLSTLAQRNSSQLAGFGQRIDEHDQVVGRLNEQLAGGRARFQLAAIEQLLLLANDRVQLARDARAAVTALEAADERLAALADPRLFKVREALARERAALLAVPQPDLAAAALTLASLMDRVPRLPLAARVPDHFQAPADSTPLPESADWWERLKASVRSALKGTFAVRRVSGPTPRLLPPEQEALAYQLLALKLEGARVALLRLDGTGFRDLCSSAAGWLRTQFRADDPGVLAALAELERLQAVELAPPLPDISRSLALLRAQLEPELQ